MQRHRFRYRSFLALTALGFVLSTRGAAQAKLALDDVGVAECGLELLAKRGGHVRFGAASNYGTTSSAWWRCPRRTRYVAESFRSMVKILRASVTEALCRPGSSIQLLGNCLAHPLPSLARRSAR